MNNQKTNYKSLLIFSGILFIVWGILGVLDSKNYTYLGYNSGDNFDVIKIEEGSPAEIAGLQVGDIIKSIGGINITDSKALNKRERAKIGEIRDFVITRDGTEQTLQLTYSALNNKDKTNNNVGFFIGLIYIFLGLFVLLKINSSLASSFAIFSICFGFLFMNGPYISSDVISSIISVISTSITLFAFTYLAVYSLKYPPTSKFLTSKNYKIIFLPMLILITIITVLTIFRPDRSGTLNMAMRLLFGAFIIFYFAISLITLIKKYLKATAEVRSFTGLNMMLLGTIIGLIPILIYFSIQVINPSVVLPGNDYVFYTLVAIPIFFTLALNQENRA